VWEEPREGEDSPGDALRGVRAGEKTSHHNNAAISFSPCLLSLAEGPSSIRAAPRTVVFCSSKKTFPRH